MRGIRANLKSSIGSKQQSNTIPSNVTDFKLENEKIKKETEELIEKTRKAIDDLNNKQNVSEQVKTRCKSKKERKFEDVIRTKSRSPSKGNETKLVNEKFDNTLINSFLENMDFSYSAMFYNFEQCYLDHSACSEGNLLISPLCLLLFIFLDYS
jgi:hypothetical protein